MSTLRTIIDSPLGDLTLLSDGERLTGLYQRGQDDTPAAARLAKQGIDPVLAAAAQQLGEYFDGRRSSFDLPLVEASTEFKRDVFAAVRGVPYGGASTYGDIADAIGKPRSVMYVAAALNANPLTIVVPCHRVIGLKSTNYAGPVGNKDSLQRLEAQHRAALEAARPSKRRGILGAIFG